MSQQVFIFFVLFAAFSTLNFGLFYLVKAIRKKRNKLLPIAIVLSGICFFSYAFELSLLFFDYPHLQWINAPLLYVLGPLFYLHVKRSYRWRNAIHFIPAVVMAIYLLPFYIKSGSEKIAYLERAFESSLQKGTSILFYLYLLHIGLYMFFGYIAIKKQSQSFGNYNSNERARSLILSLKGLYGVFAIISILSFLLCLFLDLTDNYFSGYIFYTFSWVVLFVVLLQFYLYYQGNEAFLNKAIKKPPNRFNQQADHSALISRMDALMTEKKLYRNAELKIMEVAHEVGVNLHTLSAAINQYYGHNFFDYINKLRVEELKTTLLDTSKNHLTLLAIAKESGFQSNSSFYRVFKKHTGLTPKEYIKSQREDEMFSQNVLSSNSREG